MNLSTLIHANEERVGVVIWLVHRLTSMKSGVFHNAPHLGIFGYENTYI